MHNLGPSLVLGGKVVPVHLKFSVLASQFLDDPQTMRRTVSWPVLVWEAPPAGARSLFARKTVTGLSMTQPTVAEPLVLEVRKRPLAPHPAAGIVMGRTPDCDISVADPTVSRMHASFGEERQTGVWNVTDSGSHNGTWYNGTLLIPGRPMPLFERASLRFGDVFVTFLQFSAFNRFILDWLERHSRASRTALHERSA